MLLLLTWGNFLYRHVRSTPPLLIAQQSLRAMETAERRLHIDGLERALHVDGLEQHARGIERSLELMIERGAAAAGVAASAQAAAAAAGALDESYHVVFSTGCSEFQDWQSLGVYSSAEAVGQRGVVTRVASGCTPAQEAAIARAMAHLPRWARVHFAPNTEVRDHAGQIYKYANKPLGLMHWLLHASPRVPRDATVALIDPDMFFLRPLWHDSFARPGSYLASGAAARPERAPPAALRRGQMVAQRYGIGGEPWTRAPGVGGQKAWGLAEYLRAAGRPDSPALAADLDARGAAGYYSIGAPYIALAADWLPIATNWTALMPMAVERSFGNLAEMYAMVIAVADLGIRPSVVDSLMVSNVDAGGEGWAWVDGLPMDRGCDPATLADGAAPLPTFLHYCQSYEIAQLKAAALAEGVGGRGPNGNEGTDERGAFWLFSKYQVPDEILHCPAADGAAADGAASAPAASKKKKNMKLDARGFLPEPPRDLAATTTKELRHIFSHCVATRQTNQAARDYRRWFCGAPIDPVQ